MTRLTGATELFGLSFISVCLPFHFIRQSYYILIFHTETMHCKKFHRYKPCFLD